MKLKKSAIKKAGFSTINKSIEKHFIWHCCKELEWKENNYNHKSSHSFPQLSLKDMWSIRTLPNTFWLHFFIHNWALFFFRLAWALLPRDLYHNSWWAWLWPTKVQRHLQALSYWELQYFSFFQTILRRWFPILTSMINSSTKARWHSPNAPKRIQLFKTRLGTLLPFSLSNFLIIL